MSRHRSLALVSVCLLACGGPPDAPDASVDASLDAAIDPPLTLPPRGHIALTRRDDGRVDVVDDRGTVYLRGAWAEALVREGTSESTVSSRVDCDGAWSMLDAPPNDAPYFATGEGWQWACARSDGLSLAWRFWLDHAHDTLVVDVSVGSAAEGPERVLLRLTPLLTEGDDGGLFVGARPARHRILDDGADLVRETAAFLHYATERGSPFANVLPIRPRGAVLANWNHAVVDLDGHRSLVAGALGVEVGLPTFGTRVEGAGPLDAATGRRGLTSYTVDSVLLWSGKPLHPAGAIRSESIYVDPLSEDPLVGLERYADATAAWLDVVPWTERDGGRPVPNGWNSWSGSSFSGGLGTDIDQTIMEENLAIMAREMAPFGVDYFQIDAGYEDASGDWNADAERFPDGIDTLATHVEAAGLIPGIWIQAFIAEESSVLATDHPDWLQDPADSPVAGFVRLNEGQRALDTSSPEVLGWLGDTMRRYRDDWHMRWIKLDFAYLAFLYPPRANPELSSVEAYRGALTTVRDALGPDVFYLGIGLVGMNLGVVDGMRLTLDDGPRWDEDSPDSFARWGAMKGSVRTGARRYYFNHRVWVGHDDLLFFRTAPDAPTVTLEEAITFASFVGLGGGIVKMGEDLRTLTPEQIDVWRRLLPVYPAAGRPMDLFTRAYPEVWRLPIEGTSAGSDASWMIVGLTNWGTNLDYDRDGAPAPMADEARTYTIDLAAWGLDPSAQYLAQEFWSETFLGVVEGTMTREVGAHGHAVIALRERTGHPQLLGHDRHFTQGATDLVSETWDEASATLRIRMRVDAGAAGALPFAYRVRVYGAGRAVQTEGAADETITQDGEVITVAFTPTAPGEREIVLEFR